VIAASDPVQRPQDAKLLVVDARGRVTHARRGDFVDMLRRGDLVIANDAATLPASLTGCHLPTGDAIEVRLAGWRSASVEDVESFSAIVFGAGDFHTPTEHRPAPPRLSPGDRLTLGPLHATVTRMLGHPRLALLHFDGSADQIWEGIARHGRPIQYAHMATPLSLWDVWTVLAGPPVAFEPPSAGFILNWQAIATMRARGIEFATITHAAGISSTGDAELDSRLPFDEPYEIPVRTACAIGRARADGRRVVAIGTTVVRALEHAATGRMSVRAGPGVATQRINESSRLQIVDAIVSGVHEPDTSHFQLLRAFADRPTLEEAAAAMSARGYRMHEFGDSVWIERNQRSAHPGPCSCELPTTSAGSRSG
jgi:S-adenosylmethionine:tRNA ribosyltransferase-isomerase